MDDEGDCNRQQTWTIRKNAKRNLIFFECAFEMLGGRGEVGGDKFVVK